jgi:two-component system, OmpR family, sensor kinase
MARHFLGLYLLIIATLAIVSWGQDRLLQIYSNPDATDERPLSAAMSVLADRLHDAPAEGWKSLVAEVATRTKVDVEVLASSDIAGHGSLDRLRRGDIAYMQSSAGDSWLLKRLDDDHVLAFRSPEPAAQRGLLEWLLTIGFYAAIALVLMFWIWPLTRDLRALELAAAQYGNRNWRFAADIKTHSQIYPLAEAFRRMAARIDGLIASHKDMSNAVAHEIKTPLSRMQFEIELAQLAADDTAIGASLSNIKADIAAIDDLVRATLDYAILERADLALNLAPHNLTTLVPGIVDAVRHDARSEITIAANVYGDAGEVVCDAHLFETVLKNLLYNANRYAASTIAVTFTSDGGVHELLVDDDGPGIPEQDRARVLQSFVQLNPSTGKKTGYGLGLAIVNRAIQWHGGEVQVADSPLGGARIRAVWPAIVHTDRSLSDA